jgi:hypothetical protein
MLPEGTQIKISGIKAPKRYVELAEVIRDGSPTVNTPNLVHNSRRKSCCLF